MPYIGPQGPAASPQSAAQTVQQFSVVLVNGAWTSPSLAVYGKPNLTFTFQGDVDVVAPKDLINAYYTRALIVAVQGNDSYTIYDEYMLVGAPAQIPYGTGQVNMLWREQLVAACTEVRVTILTYDGVVFDLANAKLTIQASA